MNPTQTRSRRRQPWRQRSLGLLVRYLGGVLGGLILATLVLSITLVPIFRPVDPYTQDLTRILEPPNHGRWFGTDDFGRDLFARVAVGGRFSLLMSNLAVFVGGFVGIPLGLVAGMFGGWIDTVVMRATEVLLAFPFILLAILAVTILGGGMWNAAFAIGIAVIPSFARLVRGSVLGVMQSEYITAARALGANRVRIATHHVLRSVATPIVIQATYSMGVGVLSAGALSFVGLGVQPPTPEWGALLATGRGFMLEAPHIVLLPGLALSLAIVGFNLVGDALRLALEPRLR